MVCKLFEGKSMHFAGQSASNAHAHTGTIARLMNDELIFLK